jgi:hypothetical protein
MEYPKVTRTQFKESIRLGIELSRPNEKLKAKLEAVGDNAELTAVGEFVVQDVKCPIAQVDGRREMNTMAFYSEFDRHMHAALRHNYGKVTEIVYSSVVTVTND